LGLQDLAWRPLVIIWEAVKRPKHVKAPAYLSKSPPVPRPGAAEPAAPAGEEGKLDPTRYGDWEKKGIAIDF
jgi:hypothetical protein